MLAHLVLAILMAGAPASAHVYSESGIDAPGAPDVYRVEITPRSSVVTFRIKASDAASWAGAAAILGIDTNLDGIVDSEYTLHSLHTELTHELPPGGAVATAATFSLSGAVLTINVPSAELNTRRFAFKVETPAPAGEDVAPDSGLWRFSLDATESRPVARFAPTLPTHGHRLTARPMSVKLSDGSTSNRPVTCTATLAGKKRLPGRCAWTIPVTARGKRLAVVLHAGTAQRTYSFRVR